LYNWKWHTKKHGEPRAIAAWCTQKCQGARIKFVDTDVAGQFMLGYVPKPAIRFLHFGWNSQAINKDAIESTRRLSGANRSCEA
jgi:hypothetical protein